MSTAQIIGAAIGGLFIVVVLWKAIRGGMPPAEDKDMLNTFHSD